MNRINKFSPIVIWGVSLIFLFFSTILKAQSFLVTEKNTEIDSYIAQRTDIRSEINELFDFITNFKYYDYNEVNEFEKQRQYERNELIKTKLNPNWRQRYSIIFDGQIVSSNKAHLVYFRLGKYNFNKELFSFVFGESIFQFQLDDGDRQKLKNEVLLKTNKRVKYIVTNIVLELDQSQTRPYDIYIEPEEAEVFKNKIDNSYLKCEAGIELLSVGKPSFEINKMEMTKDEAKCNLKIVYKIIYFTLRDNNNTKIIEWRNR